MILTRKIEMTGKAASMIPEKIAQKIIIIELPFIKANIKDRKGCTNRI